MKSRYIILTLVALTVLVFLFIFNNIFSIWEQASNVRFRPVTTGLHSSQIARDVKVGDVSVDFYLAPTDDTNVKRPLLVVVHGGFLQGGNKKNYAYLGGIGVRAGYAVAVAQLPHYPGIFTKPFYSNESLKSLALPAQAKRFTVFLDSLKQQADKLRFDADKIHVLAIGSGALLLGEADLQRYKSLILVSPIYSLKEHVAGIAPVQLRAIAGYINDADALRLSPGEWIKKTTMPAMLICAERDLPYIKEACKSANLTRANAKPIERIVAQKPSHFELIFHLGSKIEEATEPLKKFLFDNARL